MTPDTISLIAQETVLVAIKLIGPILLSSLVVGLIISMFQAATSINEQTLTFIPKLATIIIVLIVLGPWMLQVLIDFFQDLMLQIPTLIG
ncbi:MAG: flagellar biosynthetic protein FliQ [Methyloprofundus sp.]|nr:MAG: flagellar biosynthetic protein FliQ [Methyloprofundus sp.]